MSTSTTSNSKPLMLDQLELGVTGTIVVMICKMWDVNSATGRYLSTDFIVSDEKPNKDDFRVLRFPHFIVEIDGDTVVRKSSVMPDGFARYPFQLVEFDSLEPTNNKYLIDRLYLSSTSSTMIVDDEQIPVLKQFKSDDSGIELAKELLPADSTNAKAETLKNLLMWARNQKYDTATFHCAVRIDKIRTKRGWNYPSCGDEKFLWTALYLGRYRLELEVSDDTAQVVVVMFDETTRTVVKCLAGSIVGSEEQDEEETGLPPALANIVGTIHTLELKSNLYYEHANYESFTCWTIVLEEALDESGSSGTLVAAGGPKTGVEERHDSDGEESFVADSKTKGSNVGCSSEAGKSDKVGVG
ncbi:hypothetical protein Tco_0462776 [Tanacetum coccineum]